MREVLNLNLDYDLPEPKEGQPDSPDNPTITRNIIENAYAINNPNMGAKLSRQWRSLVKAMEEILKEKKTFLILSESDFASVYDEVYKCKYPHQQAFIVPVLLDELDSIKNRTPKDSKAILETIENSDKAADQVKKVLKMSEAKSK